MQGAKEFNQRKTGSIYRKMDRKTVLNIKKENDKMDRKYFFIALLVLAGLWAAIGFAILYFIKYFI
jgi:hypothetical protein